MTPARMAEIHAAAFAGQGRIWSETEIAAMLARPAIQAVAEGETGFALLQILPPEAEILTLAIDPAAQGRGLGTSLLCTAMRCAAQAGVDTMFLEVADDNAAARALYANAGFTETGRRRGYYTRPDGRSIDALNLTRPLFAAKTGTPPGG